MNLTIVDKSNDFAEKTIAEDKLKQSEQHYRLLFENNPLPAWIFDVDSHQFLEVNQAAIDFYGYSRKEFLSMKIWDIRPKEEITFLEEDLRRIKENKKQLQRVWKHCKKNGEIIYVEIRASSFIYDGRTSRLIMVNDVTAKVKAEASLKKSNERYRLATKASFDAIWDVDILSDTINWSEGYESLFGYNLENEEVPRASWTDHIHPDDKERMVQLHHDVLKNPAQNFINSEYRFIRADGTIATRCVRCPSEPARAGVACRRSRSASRIYHRWLLDVL